MKKHLLLTTGIFVSGLLAAQVSGKASLKMSKVPAHLQTLSAKKSAVVTDTYQQLPFAAVAKTKPAVVSTKRVNAVSESVIGTTNYDLQSNGSVGDRIVVNADGSIAAVWTYATDGTYADRGTGYNYFDGSAWYPTIPTARIEPVRTGWGNIVNTRSGRDVVISHDGTGTVKKLNETTRPVKGTGTWANSTTTIPNVSGGNWWPRMVSSNPRGGDTIYSISISYPVANGGAVYNGLDGALLFSRSTDGGVTWDISNQSPTGYTSTNYRGFSGDGYAIAAMGSTVAIIAGDSGTDLTLSKSTDGGVTWLATTVMQFPIALWDPTTVTSDIDGDSVADTLETNDGNLAIALDNFGKAYVAYGRMKILNDAPSATGYSYFPFIDGLYVWSEGMPMQMAGLNPGTNFAAFIQDLYGDNYISFPAVPSGSWPFGLTRANSLTSFPSMAFDASNNLYLSYSSIVDSLVSLPEAEKVLRHVYITKSCDGGVNWSDPLDLDPNDPNLPQEGIYGSMAKNINGNIHIIYQRDLYAGNGIPATSGTNPDGAQNGAGNDIVYVTVPTTDISCPIITGIKNEVSSVANISFYPSPASTNGTIDVVLKENAKMDIVVMSSVGQTVFTTSVNGNAGSNKIDVNLTNLSSGVYFYQVKIANNQAITNKFVVGK